MQISETPPPAGSLIAPFGARPGYYTDCFEVVFTQPADRGAFITAFYTQPLFRVERVVLRLLARPPRGGGSGAARAMLGQLGAF